MRQLSDEDALALVIWGEARAESPDGQIAVGQVVLHRLRAGTWGNTVAQVVTARSQFSCFWPWGGAQNHDRVRGVSEALAAGQAVTSERFAQARWIAQGLLAGLVVDDLVHGAMHYLTTDLLKSGLAPVWAVTMDITARIGAHTFGRVTR